MEFPQPGLVPLTNTTTAFKGQTDAGWWPWQVLVQMWGLVRRGFAGAAFLRVWRLKPRPSISSHLMVLQQK